MRVCVFVCVFQKVCGCLSNGDSDWEDWVSSGGAGLSKHKMTGKKVCASVKSVKEVNFVF